LWGGEKGGKGVAKANVIVWCKRRKAAAKQQDLINRGRRMGDENNKKKRKPASPFRKGYRARNKRQRSARAGAVTEEVT